MERKKTTEWRWDDDDHHSEQSWFFHLFIYFLLHLPKKREGKWICDGHSGGVVVVIYLQQLLFQLLVMILQKKEKENKGKEGGNMVWLFPLCFSSPAFPLMKVAWIKAHCSLHTHSQLCQAVTLMSWFDRVSNFFFFKKKY